MGNISIGGEIQAYAKRQGDHAGGDEAEIPAVGDAVARRRAKPKHVENVEEHVDRTPDQRPERVP